MTPLGLSRSSARRAPRSYFSRGGAVINRLAIPESVSHDLCTELAYHLGHIEGRHEALDYLTRLQNAGRIPK